MAGGSVSVVLLVVNLSTFDISGTDIVYKQRKAILLVRTDLRKRGFIDFLSYLGKEE